MSTAVSRHIFRFVSNNGGCSNYGDVEWNLRMSFSVAEQILSGVLRDRDRFVVVEGEEQTPGSGGSVLPLTSLVLAKTPLRVCKLKTCLGCDSLHLCRFFIYGTCGFWPNCKHSHDLSSAHNSSLLKKHDLQDLPVPELLLLLLQNDPSLLPEVCLHYNKGNGEHGSCLYKTSCINLHLCLHFLLGDCNYGASCKRIHTFDVNAMKVLNSRKVGTESVTRLKRMYRNKLLIATSSERATARPKAEKKAVPGRVRHRSINASDADHSEICLHFLGNGCSFKERCKNVHHLRPYKWEILGKDGSTWSKLENEEEIEQSFCKPDNDQSITKGSSAVQLVDFPSMTCDQSSVRRLSTASSVTKPPYLKLATDWGWYWRNDSGGWTEYKKQGPFYSSVTSEELEKMYQVNSEQEVYFTSNKQKYLLRFKEMHQQNVEYKTVREVRRRPRSDRRECPESAAAASADIVPSYWDKDRLPSFSYEMVDLDTFSNEYNRVATLFKNTMSQRIHSVKRVQNLSLWKVFQWQKERMANENGGKAVDQRYLFHGTNENLIDPICQQNFDWRVCGLNGTSYGKGSYFARDASYSNSYVLTKQGTRKMFLALVLVGEFTRGNCTLVRPPQKPDQSAYDSCVDNENGPSIFVIFEKFQIYPEYIIEYS